jgi:hypothetical protein
VTRPAARAWLEALGLEPRLPDTRFLEDLFHVFQRRVAYETLTRPAGDAGLFDAEAFSGTWPEEERGLTGEERARAFAWFAGELGFACELEESICSRPWANVEGRSEAHRSAIARVEGHRILADAGFPIPLLIPLELPSKEIPSSFGTLSIAAADEENGGSFRVLCDARGEIAELLRLGTGAGARGEAPSAPLALRVLDDRVLYWSGGLMTVLDAWSVLVYPLAADRAAFEALFALNLDGVDLPAIEAADVAPNLTVYHTVPLPPEDVRRGLERAAPPESDLVAAPEAFIEAVPGGSRIARRARFRAPVPAAGPGESVRRTLAFHLAMDLLRLGEPGGQA